jgi:DNA-binding transcriptional LysR family regulator
MSIDRYDFIRRVLVAKTVVEAGSIRKAAAKLGVTPSALSQSIGLLEKQLKVPLFVRGQGSLQPTEHCLSYISKVSPAFDVFDHLLPASRAELKLVSLDLGFYDSLAIDVLPGLISALRRDFPKIRVNILTGRSSAIASRVRQGELCLGLAVETENLGGLIFDELARDRFSVYVSRRVKTPSRIDIERLGLGCINPGSTGQHPLFMSKMIKELSSLGKMVMQSDSFETLAAAAAQGCIASVLPERVASRFGEQLTRVDVPLKNQGEHRIGLIYTEKCDAREAQYVRGLIAPLLRVPSSGS